MPIERVLEPEVMDDPDEAAEYDAMDHAAVNAAFVGDLLSGGPVSGLVVDAGAGTGLIAVELAQRSEATVLAVDAADAMLSLAVRHTAGGGLAGRVIPMRGNVRELPLPDGVADAVICNTVLHHLPRPELALAEFTRVLRPGGRLFVRDLVRPDTQAEVDRLVALHTVGCTPAARRMFAESLPAGLTIAEVTAMLRVLGIRETPVMTSDRHWTLDAVI